MVGVVLSHVNRGNVLSWYTFSSYRTLHPNDNRSAVTTLLLIPIIDIYPLSSTTNGDATTDGLA